jgi:hypothetical protein
VAGINEPGGNDVTPRLTRNELTLYFATDRMSPGSVQIWQAGRVEVGAAFCYTVGILPFSWWNGGLGSPSLSPTVTGDGLGGALTMYLESTRTGRSEIYLTTSPYLTGLWSDPQVYFDESGGPYVMPSGRVLYFHSSRFGNTDIFRVSTDTFAPVGGINSPYDDLRPVVTEDELTIYFASSRPDPDARGGWDIWVATRGSAEADFGTPSVVRELSTEQSESPGWISPDGCRLYFDRGGSTTISRIYVAQKP